jgi:DNA modification methylase
MTKRITSPRDLAALLPDENNANKGTDRGRAALDRSLRDFGAGRSVLLDRHGRVIAGNKTVEKARSLGLTLRVVQTDGTELVAVQRRDLDLETDDKAKGLAIADNRVAELDLDWDPAALEALRAGGLDVSAFWSNDEFAALLGTNIAPVPDEDRSVAPVPTDIQTGDLFLLGAHRLLCGDATSAAHVAKALNGATPVVMVTDPPYGVHYDPSWRHAQYPKQRTAVGTVLNDHRASWKDAWDLFTGPVAYVWHAGLHSAIVATDLEAANLKIRNQIVWVKQHFALSRGDYHWGHEPAFYCVRVGATSRWRGDRTQTTVWTAPNLNAMGGHRDGENAATGHGTQKPVRLWEIPLLNHTAKADVVYDPFCGSGTALIAAEKTRRTCIALELDPTYVQAAVSRWEAFTGQKAIRQPAAASRRTGREQK